jgi:hypothetical protein
MKKISVLVMVAAVMSCMFATSAFADENLMNGDMHTALADKGDIGFAYPAFEYGDSTKGVCAIEAMSISTPKVNIKNSNRLVTYSASARYAGTETSISLTITLQEKRGNTWHAIDSASRSVSNAASISLSDAKTVSGGHYYRCKAVFTATKSGTTTKYSGEKRVS